MAIYHLSAKIISRSAGRSVVAAAAYRSASCLTNEYDESTHDYTRKNWVLHSEIQLPAHAPPELSNRELLWNTIEQTEKSTISQLAREIEIALPKELSLEDQIEITRTFIETNFVSKGLCVDFAIHSPPVTNDYHQPLDKDGNITNDINEMEFRNPHAHILIALRPLDEKGKFEYKSQTEYVCKKDGIEHAFTSSEYKDCASQGWEKQYKYLNGKQKVWMTPSEAEPLNLKRLNRTPKTTPYGRKNPTIEYLSQTDSLKTWRKSWETIVNDKLELRGIDSRVDCRSFQEQGRTEELPSIHMGTEATNIERRAERLLKEGTPEHSLERSYYGEINRDIQNHNRLVKLLQNAITNVYKEAKDKLIKLAQELESLRTQTIGYRYQRIFFLKRKIYYNDYLQAEYHKLKSSSYTDTELQEYEHKLNAYEKLENKNKIVDEKIRILKNDYSNTYNTISPENQETVQSYRAKMRPSAEESLRIKLKDHYKDEYDENTFLSVIKETDKKLKVNTKKRNDSLEREFYDHH